jgi:hypothetical protein
MYMQESCRRVLGRALDLSFEEFVHQPTKHKKALPICPPLECTVKLQSCEWGLAVI